MRLYWHGHASIWDLPSAHALLSTLLGWRVRKLDVELYAEQGSLQALDEGNRYKLASLLELGASYHELPADVMQVEEAGLPLLAAVHRSDRWHLWATDAITLGLPDSEWGKPSAGGRLLRGQETVLPMAVAVGVGDIRPKTGDKKLISAPNWMGRSNPLGSTSGTNYVSILPCLFSCLPKTTLRNSLIRTGTSEVRYRSACCCRCCMPWAPTRRALERDANAACLASRSRTAVDIAIVFGMTGEISLSVTVCCNRHWNT